jgi:hypothetical protein
MFKEVLPILVGYFFTSFQVPPFPMLNTADVVSQPDMEWMKRRVLQMSKPLLFCTRRISKQRGLDWCLSDLEKIHLSESRA